MRMAYVCHIEIIRGATNRGAPLTSNGIGHLNFVLLINGLIVLAINRVRGREVSLRGWGTPVVIWLNLYLSPNLPDAIRWPC